MKKKFFKLDLVLEVNDDFNPSRFMNAVLHLLKKHFVIAAGGMVEVDKNGKMVKHAKES